MRKKSLCLSIVTASMLYAAVDPSLVDVQRAGKVISITKSDSPAMIQDKLYESNLVSYGHGGSAAANNSIEAVGVSEDGLLKSSFYIAKDKLEILGSANDIITIDLKDLNSSFYGESVNISYADLTGLDINAGDRLYLQFIDKDGTKKYLGLYQMMDNSKGKIDFANSTLKSSNLEGNALNISQSRLIDAGVSANHFNLSNTTLEANANSDTWVNSFKSTTGTGNKAKLNGENAEVSLLLKGDVAKDFITPDTTASGLSSVTPSLLYAKTKDGYTIFHISNTIENDDNIIKYFKDETNTNKTAAALLYDSDNIKLNPDKTLGLDAKSGYLQIFKQLGIADTNGVVSDAKIQELGKSIEDIIKANGGSINWDNGTNTGSGGSVTDEPNSAINTAKVFDLGTITSKDELKAKINDIRMRAITKGLMLTKDDPNNSIDIADAKYKIYSMDGDLTKNTHVDYSLDTVNIKGASADNKLSLEFDEASYPNEWMDRHIKANEINIENTDIKNLHLTAGDNILFRFQDTDGSIKYLKTYVRKDNARGNIAITNSNITNSEIEANKLDISGANLTNVDASSNTLTINNTNIKSADIIDPSKNLDENGNRIIEGTFITALKSISGANNTLTAGKNNTVSVFAKNSSTLDENMFKAASINSGLSTTTQDKISFVTKDGFRVWRVSDGTLTPNSPEEWLTTKLDVSKNITPLLFLDDLVDGIDTNGNIAMKTDLDPKLKLVLEQNKLINSDGSVNIDNFYAMGMDIDEVIKGVIKTPVSDTNVPEIPETTPELPNDDWSKVDFTTPSKTYVFNESVTDANKADVRFKIFELNARSDKNSFDVIADENTKWTEDGIINPKYEVWRITDDKSKMNKAWNIDYRSFDNVEIAGTPDKKIDFKLNDTDFPIDYNHREFEVNNMKISHANLENLDIRAGDDILFKFQDSDGKYKYIRSDTKKDSKRGNVTIDNSSLNDVTIDTNIAKLSAVDMLDSDISANTMDINNTTLKGSYLAAKQNLTGANNTLVNAFATAKNSSTLADNIFKAGTINEGITSKQLALESFVTKDGYKVWRAAENDFPVSEEEKYLAKTLDKDKLITPLLFLGDLVKLDPVKGIIVDKTIDPKVYSALEQNKLINSDDSINVDNFYAMGMDIDEVIKGVIKTPVSDTNKPSTNPEPEPKPNPKPESKPWEDLTPAKPISTSINIPKVTDVISGTSMKLDSLANMTFKDNSKVDGFVKDSNEEALYNAMYEKPKAYKKFEENKISNEIIASPKLNDITINSTNITSASKYFDKLEAKDAITITNSTINGFELTSGEHLQISDASGDYVFKDAMKTGKGTINLINSRLLNTEIRADTVNIHDVDLIGGVDDSVIFANQLNATKLNIIDGGAIVYGKATGGQNTLGASAKAIANANKEDPISIAFIKEGADDFFKIASTNAGISSITPAGIKGITKDGFKVFAIGNNEWVKSITDTDGSLKLNALAIALGEGGFSANDFYATNGKLKTDTEFYKLLASKGAINSDGNINLGALGGVYNTKKITSEIINQSFLDSIANSKDKNTGISYADVTLNKPLEASKDLVATTLKAKNLNITSDIKGFDLDSSKASEKTNLFMDKTFGKLNIEGEENKLVNIENNTIKSNELNIKNAVVKTENLASNKLNLDNVTIDTTNATKDTIITALDGATINNLKVNASNKFATIIIIKNLTGKFSKEDISIQAAQVARAAATTSDQVIVKALEDGTISYIVDPSKNSEVAKALENGASAEQAILVDKGILTSDLKISESADKTLVDSLTASGVLTTKENGSVVVDNTNTFENLIKENASSNTPSQTKKNQAAINLAHTALNQARFAYNLEINNMTKRLGEIRNLEGDQGAWIRSYAGKGSYKDYQDIKYYSFTMGADKYISNDTLLGVSLGYNRQDLSKEISGKQDTVVLSAYATKMYNNGFYLDGVMKYLNSKGKYENELLGNSSDKKLNSKTQHAILASIEAGYRMPVGEKLIIEPQAELITGYIPSNEIKSDKLVMKSNSYMPVNIKTGVNAIVKSNDKLELRAGAGGIFDLNDGKVKYEIKDIFGTKDTRTGKNSRAYANLFGSYKLNNNTRINLEAERTFGGDFKVNYSFNLNLRYQF